jgi:hypothetical protein
MISIRKLQLLAAAVTLNGAIALTMSPQVAQAASCASTTQCDPSIACFVLDQVCAPPAGCQLVSATCGAVCSSWPVSYNYVTCNYAPL